MSETYGDSVSRLRREMGLTQDEFGERFEIPLRTLQDIESGVTTKPQKATQAKLDKAFGLRSEGETESEWPLDLRAFLDILGAYMAALPDGTRAATQQDIIRRLARQNLT